MKAKLTLLIAISLIPTSNSISAPTGPFRELQILDVLGRNLGRGSVAVDPLGRLTDQSFVVAGEVEWPAGLFQVTNGQLYCSNCETPGYFSLGGDGVDDNGETIRETSQTGFSPANDFFFHNGQLTYVNLLPWIFCLSNPDSGDICVTSTASVTTTVTGPVAGTQTITIPDGGEPTISIIVTVTTTPSATTATTPTTLCTTTKPPSKTWGDQNPGHPQKTPPPFKVPGFHIRCYKFPFVPQFPCDEVLLVFK